MCGKAETAKKTTLNNKKGAVAHLHEQAGRQALVCLKLGSFSWCRTLSSTREAPWLRLGIAPAKGRAFGVLGSPQQQPGISGGQAAAASASSMVVVVGSLDSRSRIV